jgi:tripartite-type tricarboxylate transporter receptor subunit TctC
MKFRLSPVACFTALACAAGAHAQVVKGPGDYPNKPVRLVVPFVPGGPTDIQGRMLAEKLTQRFGQQVIVDNRGGANGNIGMETVARAPADGYTLVIATVGTWAVNPHLYKLPFDVTKDFTPITQVSTSPGILVVHPTVNAKTVKELIALAKEKPGALNYGSSGIGGFGHISGELFTMMTNVKMTHIPYKSSAPSLTDLISGQIQVLFNNMISTTPHVKTGRLRAIATTGAKRSPALPDLPTVAEAGVPGYENSSWSAVAGGPGMPKPLVTRLHKDLVEILRMPDIQAKHAEVGAEIVASTPEQFQAYLKSEVAKFGKLVKTTGMKAASGG